MKTKLLLFAMFWIGLMSFSQNTYVPDDVFEQFLINSGYDSGSLDDYVPTANINTVTFLEIQFLAITDLTGIEDFTALEILRCNYLQLTTLDLSQNIALTWLDCIDNQLTSLDLSQNTALTTLDCQLNQLTTVELSQNVLLTNLNCSNNNITSLNVSQNTALTSLYCSFNQLTSLNLGQNSELTFLHCYNNQLTSLDLSQNTELTNLLSENNDLNSLNIKNGNNTFINTFQTTGNPNLTCINVDDATYSTTNWTNIDTQSYFSEDCPVDETYVPDDNFENYLETHDASGNTVTLGDVLSMGNGIANDDSVTTAKIDTLTILDVGAWGISDLTGIEDFVSLTELLCDWNQLTSLDITKNTALTELNCYRNQLASLDVSQNTALTDLNCGDNQLVNLDLSNNTVLTELYCYENQLISLDVSNNTLLTELHCNHNELMSLDVSQNTALEWVNCDHNLLTSLNVNGAITLEFLNCQYNQLTSLDVSQNTALTTLYCDHNPLTTSLTVNGATSLYLIVCDNTQLTSLDVSGATALTTLYCDSNQLESLNVDGASALYWLYCQHNQLTSLDVSQNTVLDQLFCNDNQLTSLNMKNGNNVSMGLAFDAKTNPNLFCINVDDAAWSTANWSNYIDTQTSFSEDCATFLGVDDEVLAEGLKLYPNPVSDILSVESILALKKIEIYSILGQKVKEINSEFNSISTNHLSRGIFLIKIYSEKGIAVRKLIKQ